MKSTPMCDRKVGTMGIRVLLVDDHTLLRKGMRLLFEGQEGIEVIGEADDGREAVELTRSLAPDIALMDLNMRELNGIDATRQIVAEGSPTKVIALSASGDRRNVVAALQAGACGYVVKEDAIEELVEAMHTVLGGRVYLSPRLTDTVIRECVFGNISSSGAALTSREREILQLLAEGKAMKEIAHLLNISTKTVESHRRAMMEKLQLFSMAELTKHAVREGLTTLD
jgi:DNA-binding NarL/FixJ family response regulator